MSSINTSIILIFQVELKRAQLVKATNNIVNLELSGPKNTIILSWIFIVNPTQHFAGKCSTGIIIPGSVDCFHALGCLQLVLRLDSLTNSSSGTLSFTTVCSSLFKKATVKLRNSMKSILHGSRKYP